MAITFTTSDPVGLLKTFKKAIDDGHVVTWIYDKDGDFTHNTDQWRYQAWLRPTIQVDRLVMTIIPRKDRSVTKAVYGVYHGRFIESLLTHCDELFSNAFASAMPAVGDIVIAA